MTSNKNSRVLCFDPGLTNTGWSVLDFSNTHPNIQVVRFGTIKPSPTASKVAYRDEVEAFGKRTISLQLLREQAAILINAWKPDYIAIEGAFFNPRMPTAFAALTQWLCVVDMLCYKEFGMRTYHIAPKSVKQTISSSGTSGKLSVMDAVRDNENINFKQKKQVEGITEHESDSIAIGYHFIQEIVPGLVHVVPPEPEEEPVKAKPKSKRARKVSPILEVAS